MTIRHLSVFLSTAALAAAIPQKISAQSAPGTDFNSYIVRAVSLLNKEYAAKGYGPAAYTHPLRYGPSEIKPSKAPYTMCVAAVAEVIITALNLYMEEHGADPRAAKTILNHLPPEGWARMRPQDLRSHLWVDGRLKSYGTADALSTFGVGKHAKFSELRPGAFINLNRMNKSGHAVVFLGYIDKKGNELKAYGPAVAGFRYFSSQGRTYSAGSGFGYRYAFLNQSGVKFCPSLGDGRKVDCGIIARMDQNNLNTGYMLLPTLWDKAYRDRSLKLLADKLYRQDYSRGRGTLAVPGNLSKAQFMKELETKDTMAVDPKYLDQTMPDDR